MFMAIEAHLLFKDGPLTSAPAVKGAQHIVQGGPVLPQQVAKVVVVGQVPEDGILDLQHCRLPPLKGQFLRLRQHHLFAAAVRTFLD